MNLLISRTAVLSVCLCFLTATAGFSQVVSTPGIAPIDYERARLEHVATAVRITDEIDVDGRLDESAWKLAVPATDFTQRFPTSGAPATQRTEVRFLYDDENIYVGAYLFDSDPAGIVSNDLEEDFNFRSSDLITIAMDSLHDRRSGFMFSTNPAGAKYDAQMTNNALSVDWDGVWDVKTTINGEGWIAEFVIPFRTMRFSQATTQVWGLNMNRKVLRLNEDADWSPLPVRYNISRVSEYGTLVGLEGIHQGRNLKVTPYVTAGVTQVRPAGNPFGDFASDENFDGGADLKYSLTPSLTLDGTYRTDFAQVEVDQQQVNLTRFSLFFPEKRDFFLENAGTFSFGVGNNLVPFFSRRIGLSSAGSPIPIIGGARVTGKAGRYDMGFLTMKTERVGQPGEPGHTPSNNYAVGRIKRNIRTSSWVGALVTHRNSTVSGDYNRVFGLDARLLLLANRLGIDTNILKSKTAGKSGQNLARQFEVAWRDNELVAVAAYNAIQPQFNPEVGFVRRGNNTQYTGEITWNPRLESSDLIRNLVFGTQTAYNENATTKKIETRTSGVDLGVRFENNATIDFNATEIFDRLTTAFKIRSDISIPAGDYSYLGYTLGATSNPGRTFSGGGGVDWGEFWNGDRTSLRGNFSWKPSPHFKVDANYSRNDVTLPNGQFTTDLVGTRFLYAFNPRTFLNAFIQYNADTRQVSSNIRFNIIHHPLSDLFIVYNDLRDTHNGQVLQRALTFKLTNLFNF
jgi:hypothetical protein